MKERTLSRIAVVLSIVSIGYSAWVHHEGSEVLAMRALKRREAELVRHWSPKFAEIYTGMGAQTNALLKPPTSLEELFDPLVQLMNGLGGDSDTDTNAIPK